MTEKNKGAPSRATMKSDSGQDPQLRDVIGMTRHVVYNWEFGILLPRDLKDLAVVLHKYDEALMKEARDEYERELRIRDTYARYTKARKPSGSS